MNDKRSKDISITLTNLIGMKNGTVEVRSENNTDVITNQGMVLPIEFRPNDVNKFKELLLLHKRAIITIFYASGTKEKKKWNAFNITEKSDIIRNLRSRVEFRQGNWQDANVNSIKVEIVERIER